MQRTAGFAAEVIGWNGLTDGRTKYIFHAKTGHEPFFNLTAGPHVTVDLVSHPAMQWVVAKFRGRVAASFKEEQRRDGWSRDAFSAPLVQLVGPPSR